MNHLIQIDFGACIVNHLIQIGTLEWVRKSFRELNKSVVRAIHDKNKTKKKRKHKNNHSFNIVKV